MSKHLASLAKMMSDQIQQLTRKANQYSRMSYASICPAERRQLREAARQCRKDALRIKARHDKIFGTKGVTNAQAPLPIAR